MNRGSKDTSDRRKYTLIADTYTNRALIDVTVRSNLRKRIMIIDSRKVRTTWKQSFWVEEGEVVSIDLEVWTYGDHRLRTAPWSRCQILRNGVQVDAEVDQRPIVRNAADVKRQAYAGCVIHGG